MDSQPVTCRGAGQRQFMKWAGKQADCLRAIQRAFPPAAPLALQMVPSAPQAYFTKITEVRAVKQPALTLAVTDPNVSLYWPAPAAAFELQIAIDLSPAATWGPAYATYATNNGVILATVPASTAPNFFRLKLP